MKNANNLMVIAHIEESDWENIPAANLIKLEQGGGITLYSIRIEKPGFFRYGDSLFFCHNSGQVGNFISGRVDWRNEMNVFLVGTYSIQGGGFNLTPELLPTQRVENGYQCKAGGEMIPGDFMVS